MLDSNRSSTDAYEEGGSLDKRELDTRSTGELEEEITELCGRIDVGTYRLLLAIAEFDRREAWGWGVHCTVHWLSWKMGIDLVTAREKVRVARALEGLPKISEKFRRGEVSYSKVRAMTRVATVKNEEDLLYIAENGDGVSAETCRRLACDAPHVTVGEDNEGNLLHVGSKARKISTPLWRALMMQDRTCLFPGCARTRHLQAHHIQHWAKGGEANPGNLILLCGAHHWAVHEGGLQVKAGLRTGSSSGGPTAAFCPRVRFEMKVSEAWFVLGMKIYCRSR